LPWTFIRPLGDHIILEILHNFSFWIFLHIHLRNALVCKNFETSYNKIQIEFEVKQFFCNPSLSLKIQIKKPCRIMMIGFEKGVFLTLSKWFDFIFQTFYKKMCRSYNLQFSITCWRNKLGIYINLKRINIHAWKKIISIKKWRMI